MTDQPEMSPEQWRFLAEFSDNYVAGRKLLCWLSRGVVAVGLLAGTAAAIAAAYHSLIR